MIKYCQGFWKRFWFSWLFSCTMIYLLYWLNFLMELMIFNILQTHFKMLCQRRSGDLNISLLLYDSWKLKAFSFNSIPSENVFQISHNESDSKKKNVLLLIWEKMFLSICHFLGGNWWPQLWIQLNNHIQELHENHVMFYLEKFLHGTSELFWVQKVYLHSTESCASILKFDWRVFMMSNTLLII